MEGSEFWIGQRMEDGGMGDGVGRVVVRTRGKGGVRSAARLLLYSLLLHE